jgi:hypothetical protein
VSQFNLIEIFILHPFFSYQYAEQNHNIISTEN